MRILPTTFLFFVTIALCARQASAQPPKSVEFPNCNETRFPSPDGRWEVVAAASPYLCPDAGNVHDVAAFPKEPTPLALRLSPTNRNPGSNRELPFDGSNGSIGWSTDSQSFFVNEHIASNDNEAYVYRATEVSMRIDLGRLIRNADYSARKLSTGHRYTFAREWLDNHTVLVQYCGHTDDYPVVQFDFRYRVTLNEGLQKVSTWHGHPNMTKGDCVWRDIR
jgi:hypothetical protein